MNGYYGNQGDSRLPDVFSPSPIIQGGTVGFYKVLYLKLQKLILL
jgi:hypothetical protein